MEKPVDEFYRHPQTADGFLNNCKECKKAYQRTRPYNPEYERKRWQDPKRRAKKLEYDRTHRLKHPYKARARATAMRAVYRGKLQRMPCEVCGAADTEAHHEDYSKPLDVRWLCFLHHRQRHGQLQAV